MNNDLKEAWNLLQYRQDLHDRLFHNDIYVLDKHRRLQHLTLHLCKYTAQLFSLNETLAAADIELPLVELEKKFNKNCIDGVVVSLSILNVCNTLYSEMGFKYQLDSPENSIKTLIERMGMLAKVIEDIDHMASVNPLEKVSNTATTMLIHFTNLYNRDGSSINDLLGAVWKRLEEVEVKHIFYAQYRVEMLALLEAGYPDKSFRI